MRQLFAAISPTVTLMVKRVALRHSPKGNVLCPAIPLARLSATPQQRACVQRVPVIIFDRPMHGRMANGLCSVMRDLYAAFEDLVVRPCEFFKPAHRNGAMAKTSKCFRSDKALCIPERIEHTYERFLLAGIIS